MTDRLLAIYLNDQLALGVAGRELARRAARENAGSEVGSALADAAAAIADDVATLELVMRSLGVRRSRVKPRLATLAERGGRLKLNGSVRRYSPLSRFYELDLLVLGIGAKKVLWATLRDLSAIPQRLPGIDLDELIARADAQLDLLEPWRTQAGLAAFGNLDRVGATLARA
jgi:hypothetical protein